MKKKSLPIIENIKLDKIVGGGQAIGTLDDGKKIFVWGGLPGEIVNVKITKKKSKMIEGVVTEVVKASDNRITPRDSDSYLSTSPWQIMDFDSEQNYKATLIAEAFELHNLNLPNKIKIFSDHKQFEYRNKIEFSWYWNKETEQLDLAFFQRGSHGKIPVEGTSLAHPNINKTALKLRDLLRQKNNIQASMLKTLLIRSNQNGEISAQLYVKEPDFPKFTEPEIENLVVKGFELIYSNPQSPASVVTEKIQSYGEISLSDKILNVSFKYTTEGFFQINLPVYEQALNDMKKWVSDEKPTIDLYSGVGTIGLTIGTKNVTMVEINEKAVEEMRRNIAELGRKETVKAILAPSENALECISGDATIIVDPPRAGLHDNVIEKLLETTPPRIIYLSCNPVTQARDVAKLMQKYNILYHRGYNFFPRTPHIEHLVVLDSNNNGCY